MERAAASRRNGTGEKPDRPEQAEFLSGFYREDRLLPVVTLVILFATEDWDGPVRLSAMFGIVETGIMEYVPDYKINLMAPAIMSDEEINRLSSSLREVILYIRNASDEARLELLLKEDERFKRLDIKAARVLNELMYYNLQLDEEGEEVDMCKAIDDMKRHALEQGIEQGTLTGIVNLMASMKLTAEQAMDALLIPMDKRTAYGKKLQ